MADEINIVHEIKSRVKVPFNPVNYAYFGYLFGILIGFGGLGIWSAIYQFVPAHSTLPHNTIPMSIATYFVALLASSFIDLNVLPNAINRVSFIIYSVIILGLGIFLFWLCFQIESYYSFIPAFLGILFAIFCWHIANSDSEKFSDTSFNERIRTEAKEKHGGNWP